MCRKEIRTLSQALTLRYDKVLFILDPTNPSKSLAGKKVVVCDCPDGRLEIMHESFALPYRTFDKLRSVHRSEVVENKRLDDMLSIVAEMQAGRQQQRSKSGPRRTGQTDHMFGIPDGSKSNGYKKRGRKPGRRADFMNDELLTRIVSKLKESAPHAPLRPCNPAQPVGAGAGRRRKCRLSNGLATSHC